MEEKILELMQIAFDEDLQGKKLSEISSANVENWDSFSFLNLLSLLEEEFNITFSTGEVVDMFNTGAAISKIVAEKMSGK